MKQIATILLTAAATALIVYFLVKPGPAPGDASCPNKSYVLKSSSVLELMEGGANTVKIYDLANGDYALVKANPTDFSTIADVQAYRHGGSECPPACDVAIADVNQISGELNQDPMDYNCTRLNKDKLMMLANSFEYIGVFAYPGQPITMVGFNMQPDAVMPASMRVHEDRILSDH